MAAFPSIADNKFVRAAKQFPAASAGVAANASQKASVLSYTDVSGELPDAQMGLNFTFREFVVVAPGTTITSANLIAIIPDGKLGDNAHVFAKAAAANTYWSNYSRWAATAADANGVVTTWTQL